MQGPLTCGIPADLQFAAIMVYLVCEYMYSPLLYGPNPRRLVSIPLSLCV